MRTGTAFVGILLAGAAAPAAAQDDGARAAKIAELEGQLEQQMAALNQLREELDQLKQAAPPADTKPALAGQEPIDTESKPKYLASGDQCRLDSPDRINSALAEPKQFAQCYTLTDASRPQYVGFFGERDRLLPGDAMTAQPGRPLQLAGVVPQIEFGSSGKASLTATIPIKTGTLCSANCRNPEAQHRRYALTSVAALKTDLNDGVGTFLDRREREGRRELDYLGGTTIKLGFDYLQYDWRNGGASTKAIQDFVGKARTACLTAQHNQEIAGQPANRLVCDESRVIDWVLRPKASRSEPSGYGFANEALAEELKSLMAGAAGKEIPSWGFGASATGSNSDYKFQQGTLLEAVDPDSSKRSLVLDTSIPLAGKVEEGHRDYLAEGHLFIYASLDSPERKYAPIWNVPGVMFVPQLTYRSFWEFRPGTKKSICSGGGTIVNVVSCTDVQVDRPYRRTLTALSGEFRMKFEQVPVFGQIGFAPRAAYTLDDGGAVFDLPIYFTDSKGSMSAGVRFRHVEGGRDALGNREQDYDQISLFFTPLRFNAF